MSGPGVWSAESFHTTQTKERRNLTQGTHMLANILAAAPARSIDDVVSIMTRIEERLPDSDGLKWFNHLYLRVTVWTLQVVPSLRDRFFDRLDRLTGFAGRGLLLPHRAIIT
jgi:hypothetical protein